MTYALLFAAFMMGIFGSPHCLGMCGGLVTAFGLSMQSVSPTKKRWLIATYHLGRVLSYAFLGVVAGLIGIGVLQPFMQGNILPRILLGLVLVFIGMTMLGAPLLNKLESVGMRFWQKLSPLRQKVFPLTSFPKALAAGLLWGFLPCGLVYAALMMAVVGHSITTGAMLMFAFGLGTIPMLVATQSGVAWLQDKIGRFHLRQLNGSVMVLSGLAVIALPIVMSSMHGGHGSHGAASTHGNHLMNEDTATSLMIDSDMNHQDHSMSHEAMSHEAMSHEAMSHEAMSHEAMSHEAMSHEAMSHEAMSHEAMSHEAMPSESMSDSMSHQHEE